MEFRILEDVFAQLPPINSGGTDYPINFHYGSQADLMEFLAVNRKSKGAIAYPLIWLQTPVEFAGYKPPFGQSKSDVILHIVTLSNGTLSNRERVRSTFANTLEPLTDNVIRALKTNQATGIDETSIRQTKTFKFDTDESNSASDIWDAITLSCTIEINYNCTNILS